MALIGRISDKIVVTSEAFKFIVAVTSCAGVVLVLGYVVLEVLLGPLVELTVACSVVCVVFACVVLAVANAAANTANTHPRDAARKGITPLAVCHTESSCP